MAPSPSFLDRFAISIFVSLVTLALIIEALCGTPLAYDGSIYLFYSLDLQTPLVANHRLIDFPLEMPVVAASRFIHSPFVLNAIFSVPFAAVPAIGLALSSLPCRKRPSLYIWPALGIGLAMLPGLFHLCSESQMTAALAWPILLAILVGISAAHLPAIGLAAVALYFTHPIGAVYLAFASISAAITGYRLPAVRRSRLAAALLLGLLAVGRARSPLTDYEQHQMSVFAPLLRRSFRIAVAGGPLGMLGFTFIAAAICLWQTRTDDVKTQSPWNLALPGAVLAAGLCLLPWAMSAHAWSREISYKNLLPFFTVMLMGACALDSWRVSAAAADGLWAQRRAAIALIGAICLVILSIQSAVWWRIRSRLMADIRAAGHGCISRAALGWDKDTPLYYWSMPFYAILLQGQRPAVLVLERNDCRIYRTAPFIHLFKEMRSKNSGWFDLSGDYPPLPASK